MGQGLFDPEQRALEKQASRDDDARALASGEKSCEQLRIANSAFRPLRGNVGRTRN
jgi:hypothetical protein